MVKWIIIHQSRLAILYSIFLARLKIKQLEHENQEQKQIITNLRNDKQRLEESNNSLNSLNKGLERQLIQTQQEKKNLLKILSVDLKQQETLTQLNNNKQENTQELHQQLITQIEISLKN